VRLLFGLLPQCELAMENLLIAAQLQYAQQYPNLDGAAQQQQLQAQLMNPAVQQQLIQQQFAQGQQQFMQQQQKAAAAVATPGTAPTADASIPGLTESLMECLAKVAHLDTSWDLEEMIKRVHSYFTKAAKKYENEERAQNRGSSVQAQALIEEFVSTCLGAVAAACYDKAWFTEADFSGALMVTAMYTFRGGKLFCKTLGPVLKRYVDDGVFRYREEERIQKAMWDAVSISGLDDSYHKKATKHIQAAYDEAHMSAPYGSTTAETPEMGLVCDFVKCWMKDFVNKAWDVLEHGVVGGKDEQFAFLTTLFQYLTDPERSCLPHDLAAQLPAPPPQNWAFIGELAMQIFQELEAEQAARKKAKLEKWGQTKRW
jgi:hypothetical protein